MELEAEIVMLRLQLQSAEERAALWENIANSEKKRAEEAELRVGELLEELWSRRTMSA